MLFPPYWGKKKNTKTIAGESAEFFCGSLLWFIVLILCRERFKNISEGK
jgi:hypothetical protein